MLPKSRKPEIIRLHSL